MTATAPPFRTLVLDAGLTISGIEGIDWLAAQRGDVVALRVSNMTQQAMQGGVPLEQIYGARLAEIRPRRDEVDALSRAYVEALAPGVPSIRSRVFARAEAFRWCWLAAAFVYALLRLLALATRALGLRTCMPLGAVRRNRRVRRI